MSYSVTILTVAGLNSILALSVYLTLATGQFSLAQVGFWAIGAYGAAMLTTLWGWPLLPALLLPAVASFFIGLALGYPCLRVRGIYLALATLGFSEVVRIFFLNYSYQIPIDGVPTGPHGVLGFRNVAVLTQPWHVFLALAVMAMALFALERSRYGLALAAVQEDEVAAAASGMDPIRAKLLAFALAASMAAIGGGLYANYMSFITSGDFDFHLTMLAVLFVGAGGIGTLFGPIFGAFLLTLLPEFIRPLQAYRMIAFGLLVTVIVLIRPRGLIDEDLVRWIGRNRSAPGRLMNQPLLRIDGLSKRFGGVVALELVDLLLGQGEILGLIGPNGSGKTTMVNIVSGFLRPSEGKIRAGDAALESLSPHRIVSTGLSRTFQNLRVFRRRTVLENVLIGQTSRVPALDALIPFVTCAGTPVRARHGCSCAVRAG